MVSKSSSAAAGRKGFGSPASSRFGGLAAPAASAGSLSYLAETPDLSSVSDPNIVVSLKNLLKKDSTTKSKALSDLIAYAQAHPHEQDGGVEQAILEAWVQLYPRIAIDNDRRVRELSHTLQLELLKSARKRMERYIPQIAGAWLAGEFDREKPVARAATQGLHTFLPTKEKIINFWNKCQPQLLQYATEAITETRDSLSDERSTKAEDMDAKYYRALAGGLSLVHSLLQNLAEADTEKFSSEYESFMSSALTSSAPGKSDLSFATTDDSHVRQIFYQLLQVCLEKKRTLLEPHMSSLAVLFTSKILKKPQLGSAPGLLKVLTLLTREDATLWGNKSTPLERLQGFVEKGSQGSPSSFWIELNNLLAALPADAVSAEAALDFLKSFRAGISASKEPRTNSPIQWRCYLNTVSRLLNQVGAESRGRIVAEAVFPLTDNYLFTVERQGQWSTGSDVSILSHAFRVAALSTDLQVKEALGKEWERLAEALIARLSNSLPEVSKEFDSSQKNIADIGERWFSVASAIHAALAALPSQFNDQKVPDYSQPASLTVIGGAVDLLKRRNYKPFGAAAILLSALKRLPSLFTTGDQSFWISVIPSGSDEEMTKLLLSPSAPYIVSCVETLREHSHDDFKALWPATIRSLLALDRHGESALANEYITRLISNPSIKSLALDNAELQDHLEKNMLVCAQSGHGSWDLFNATLLWDVLPEASLRKLASTTVETLSSENEPSIKALEIMLQKRPALFSDDEALHFNLVAKLLGMVEIKDSGISSRATQLRSLLENHGDAQPSVRNIIHENLERPQQNSLAIETLVEQATAMPMTNEKDLEQILPNATVWMEELSRFLQGDLNPTLALTSNIGAACFLSQTPGTRPATQIPRDQRGLSVPARMAMYTVAVLGRGIGIDTLSQQTQTDLLYLVYLTAELASDQITLMDTAKLFETLDEPSLIGEVEEFVTSARKVIHGVFAKSPDWRPGTGKGPLDELVGTLMQRAQSLDPTGFYGARALSEILETLSHSHGHGSVFEEWILQLDIMKATPTTVLPAVAVLTGYGELLAGSKAVSNLLNRLVSDIAGATPQEEKTMLSLVLLNACMPVYDLGQLPVANNRLVFAVKQITSWFEQGPEALSTGIATESCRALQRLLPCIREVYGPYWEQTIEFCLSLWDHASKDDPEQRLPYIQASVKLLSALRKVDEPNDDLAEALECHADSVYHGLLGLIKLPGSTRSQPQEVVDALLCREAARIPLDHLKDLTDIYGLMASESREIQTAGFDLLHRALPAAQEQVSLDVLLEKKQARLPDELTSLLLDAPTLEAYPEEALVQFPTPIRSYLLSWKLVFDAFEGAAYKVRTDYTEDLKTNDAISPLMEFMFDVLGHSAASPINLDKEGFTIDDIQDYDIKIADSLPEEKNMHWLLIHLFYLALKFAPGLFKAWFLDCRSKQTKIAIEPWLIKYFSPLIVHDAIAEVEKWAKSQDASDPDESGLTVKVNYAQREITAIYAIDDGGDEQAASMLVKIKPNYPLEFVDVVGLNRVACSERTWQSWMRITQGVITISNGSIIDGLSTFRRNVVGSLKGHVECAICYSFIAVDKKMPDKRCSTCNNLFHRDCLFKWFSSANQNTCPLCRTSMQVDSRDKKAGRTARRVPVDG